jgi:hypothetical protein
MNKFFRPCALALLGMVLATGCVHHPPKAYAISIVPKTPNTVPVDLIGVNNDQFQELMNMNVDDYWSPDNVFRKTADRFPVQVSGGQATPAGLAQQDPIWHKWLDQSVSNLVIIADLRGEGFKGLGRLDPRRTYINLTAQFVSNSIVVEIQDKAVRVVTPINH